MRDLQRLKCELCPQGFYDYYALNIHMDDDHSQCSTCKEYFPDESRLIQHVTETHGEDGSSDESKDGEEGSSAESEDGDGSISSEDSDNQQEKTYTREEVRAILRYKMNK